MQPLVAGSGYGSQWPRISVRERKKKIRASDGFVCVDAQSKAHIGDVNASDLNHLSGSPNVNVISHFETLYNVLLRMGVSY